MRRRICGLSLMEVVVVLAITALLMAILVPVMGSAKRSAKVSNASQNLRQLSMALNLYRADWGGSDSSFESYHGLGLPPVDYVRSSFTTEHAHLMRSPCGLNESAFNTALFPGHAGYVSPVFALADPSLGPEQPAEFREHIAKYQQNSVMMLDVNCNEAGIEFNDQYVVKRGLAVLFSGQLVNRKAPGHASNLKWFTDLPIKE
jgi:competence protein ComGC